MGTIKLQQPAGAPSAATASAVWALLADYLPADRRQPEQLLPPSLKPVPEELPELVTVVQRALAVALDAVVAAARDHDQIGDKADNAERGPEVGAVFFSSRAR